MGHLGNHVHELLHAAAAPLFFAAGVLALMEYRTLRERVVLKFGGMCLCSGAYASYVAISHNLPKQGAFWIPWTLFGLVFTFAATTLYLATMRRFLDVPGRAFTAILSVHGCLTVVAFADLVLYALTQRSMLFVSIPRSDIGAHQYAVGEGAYSLLPAAEVAIALFAVGFVLGTGYLIVHLIRNRSRDWLVFAGLVATSVIIVNEALVAASLYAGVYLLGFTKAFETIRIYRDIRTRARERIERRLRQMQKMDAIGRFAGGIAHDFNNILMAVGTQVELAADTLDAEHPAREDLVAATQAVDTGARLVRQILDIVRSDGLEPSYIDVSEFVSNSAKLLSTMVPASTTLEFELDSDAGCILVPQGQLTQALMNLVVNASDAMPEGGTVRISAAKAPALEPSPTTSSPGVMICVIDEGVGIPAPILEHVFEPMFTTKAEQGGSGLGLATLYSIVEDAGGHVEVESEVGHGTCFRLFFPLADPPAESKNMPKLGCRSLRGRACLEHPIRGRGSVASYPVAIPGMLTCSVRRRVSSGSRGRPCRRRVGTLRAR